VGFFDEEGIAVSEKNLRVKILFDEDGRGIRNARSDLDALTSAVLRASGGMDRLHQNFSSFLTVAKRIAGVAVGFFTIREAIDQTITAGIKLNRTLEDAQAGIAALVAANTKGADALQRFQSAMGLSEEVLQKLKKASVETAATFPQLTEIFQQAIGGALGAGKSFGRSVDEIIANTIKLSQRMSNIANAIGMPMHQVNEEIRSIIEGTITADSRIAKMLHLTNEEIKKAKESVGGLAKYLEERLAPFDVLENIDTFSRALARAQDQIDTLRLEISKPIFDDLKEEFIALSRWLKENQNDIVFYGKTLYFWGKKIGVAVSDLILKPLQIVWNVAQMTVEGAAKYFWDLVQIAEDVVNALIEGANSLPFVEIEQVDWGAKKHIARLNQALEEDWKDIQRAFGEMTNLFDDLERIDIEYTISMLDNSEKRQSTHKLELDTTKRLTESQKKALEKLNREFQKHFSIVSDDPYERLVQQYEEYLKKYESISGSKAKIDEWYYRELEKLNQRVIEEFEREEERRLQAKHDAYMEYLEATGRDLEYWAIREGEKLQKLFEAGLSPDQLQEIYEADYKKFMERFRKDARESAEDVESLFTTAAKGIYSSFEANFFDLITGRFDDFGSFLKRFFSDLLRSVFDPFARQASAYLSSALGAFVGIPQMSLPSIASSLGLTFQNGQYVGLVGGTEVIIDAAGNVIKGSEALPSDTISAISIAKNVTPFLYAPSAYAGQLAGQLYGAGFTTTGQFVGGVANWLGGGSLFSMQGAGLSAQAGALIGGASIGAGGGYMVGSLGDWLFGKQTKASQYGAITGALGSLAGPVGALVGSVVGSILGGIAGGKWRMEDFGVGIVSPVSSIDTSGLREWEFWRKEKWFGGDDKSDRLKEMDSYMRERIRQLLQSLENLHDMVTGAYDQVDIVLQRGKFSNQEDQKYFDEYVAKIFLAKISGIDEAIQRIANAYTQSGYLYEGGWDAEGLMLIEKFYEYRLGKVDRLIEQGVIDAADKAELERLNEIYDAWKAYAESLDKGVIEAIQEAFASIQVELDKFEEFNLTIRGLDGEAIVEAKNSIQALESAFSSLEPMLEAAGVEVEEVGEITIQNFEEIYRALIQNNPTPETIEALNRFGDALLAVEGQFQESKNKIEHFATVMAVGNEGLAKSIEDTQSILAHVNAVYTELPPSIQSSLGSVSQITAEKLRAVASEFSETTPLIGQLADALSVLKQAAWSVKNDLLSIAKEMSDYEAVAALSTQLQADPYKIAGEALASLAHQVGFLEATAEEFAAQIQSGWGSVSEYALFLAKQGENLSWGEKSIDLDQVLVALAPAIEAEKQNQSLGLSSSHKYGGNTSSSAFPVVSNGYRYGNDAYVWHQDNDRFTISLGSDTSTTKTTDAIPSNSLSTEVESLLLEFEIKKELFQFQTFSSEVERAKAYVELLREQFPEFAEVTQENFLKMYEAALEASPTRETLERWKEFGQALQDLARAEEKAYNQAKELEKRRKEEERKAREAFYEELEKQNRRWNELLAALQKQELDNYINSVREKIDAFSQDIGSLSSASTLLEGLITRFSEPIQSPEYKEALFYSYLDLAKAALQNGRYAEYASYLKKMGAYTNFIEEKTYSSKYERNFEIARLLNELKDLKSPTDMMLETIQAIKEANEEILEQESLTAQKTLELVDVKIGGRTFQEITTDGIIEAIRSGHFTFALGQSLSGVEAILAEMGATWQEVKLDNGKMAVLVDFDQDGVSDMRLAFDSSRTLQEIDTNTARQYQVLEKTFGGKSIEYLLKDGLIASIFNEEMSISLGDSLNSVVKQLEEIGGAWRKIGDSLIVDFDRNGIIDVAIKFDETGFLKEISDNTNAMADLLANTLQEALQEVVKVGGNISSESAKNYRPNTQEIIKNKEVLAAADTAKLYKLAAKYMEYKPTEYFEKKDEILMLAKQISDLAKKILAEDPPGGQDYSKVKTGLYREFATIEGATGLYTAVLSYFRRHGYATGGYTGDGPWNQIAGVVHRGEFVVNAPTTRVLGLNRDNGGVFVMMLESMVSIKNDMKALNVRVENIEQYTRETAENTQPIRDTQRWTI